MQKLTIPVTETTSRRWRGASTLHFHAGERKAARKQKLKEKQREAQAKKAGKAPATRPAAEDDDSDDDRDYDASKLVRAEKLAAKPKLKGKRKRERDALLAREDRSGFEFDASDDRFRGLLDGDDQFGVDTSTGFKKTAGMSAVLEAIERRRAKRDAAAQAAAAEKRDAEDDAPAVGDLAASVRAKLAKRKQKKKARK